MPGLRKLISVGEILGLSCSADGSLVAINDDRGRVRFLVTEPEPEWLPLEFDAREVRAVLLHADGRVCVLVGDVRPIVRIHDPRTGVLLRTIDPGLAFEHEEHDEHDERETDELGGSERDDRDEALRRLHACILEHRPPLCSLLPIEIVNNRQHAVTVLPEAITSGIDQLLWPDRMSRLALHADGRTLAVLDRGCFVIDLESGALISTIDRSIDLPGLIEYGEGSHTIAFDERGAVLVATTAISGNPYLSVDRFDTATGEHRAKTENWQQEWFESHEIHVYDPTTILPPKLIPPGEYAIMYRRNDFELWSNAGLQRTHPLPPNTGVIPGFDPGNFCSAADGACRSLWIDDDGLTLHDLLTGERKPCRPRASSGELLRAAALRYVEFVPGRPELLLWTSTELLATTQGGDLFARLELPRDRRVQRWALAGAASQLRVVMHDEAGDLWLGALGPESGAALPRAKSLATLEADVLARPHAIEVFEVWADALSERGDPRGELIMLQARGAEADAAALIRRYAFTPYPGLLAGLYWLSANAYELVWQLGCVREAVFRVADRDELAEVLCFLGSDTARLLESLEVEFADSMEPRFRDDLRVRLAAYLHAAARWPLLRTSPRLT
jgi:hypothetical protein